jgi:hypothetical protein
MVSPQHTTPATGETTMPRTFTTDDETPDTRDLSDDRSYGCPACDMCAVDVDYPATRCEECLTATTTEAR